MLIPITRTSPSSSTPTLPPELIRLGTTLLLLELQGTLEVTGTPDPADGGGLVGELKMNGDKPLLQIGHHLLEGKIVTLPKPLAVLRKRGHTTSHTHPSSNPAEENTKGEKNGDEMMLDPPPSSAGAGAGGVGGGGEAGTSYEVVEIVRKKVVFSRRPALVVGKPQVNGVKRP